MLKMNALFLFHLTDNGDELCRRDSSSYRKNLIFLGNFFTHARINNSNIATVDAGDYMI